MTNNLKELLMSTVIRPWPTQEASQSIAHLTIPSKRNLYMQQFVELNTITSHQRTLILFKEHCIHTYKLILESSPIASTAGYHSAVPVISDNKSMGLIIG